jgi:hypothetical protein
MPGPPRTHRALRIWAQTDPAYTVILARDFITLAYAYGNKSGFTELMTPMSCYPVWMTCHRFAKGSHVKSVLREEADHSIG